MRLEGKEGFVYKMFLDLMFVSYEKQLFCEKVYYAYVCPILCVCSNSNDHMVDHKDNEAYKFIQQQHFILHLQERQFHDFQSI